VQLDTLAVRLRGRTAMQAADLGVRLLQATAPSVYASFAVVALPTLAFAIALSEIAPWLPILGIWLLAPWFDRTILFVLSRAAFGQQTTPRDVWKAQRQVWWRHAWFTLLVRRLSPWRPVTEPVYALEGLSLRHARRRVLQINRRQSGAGVALAVAFGMAELALLTGLISLVIWFSPRAFAGDVLPLQNGAQADAAWLFQSVCYAATVFFIEPFYVASGFGLYLNRRAELEAWDIEQEFRRAFAA
jgi:hypothetical protein